MANEPGQNGENNKIEMEAQNTNNDIPGQKHIKKKHSVWTYILYALAAVLGIVMVFEDYRIALIYLIVLLFLFVKEGSHLWERMFALLIISLLTVYIVYRLVLKYFI